MKNVFVFRFQRCLSFQMIESGNGGKIFLTTCNSNVNFIKLQQVCQSQFCCNLSFAETWYNLLKQLAASLWITSFDNQLAVTLLTTCNRLVVNKLSQAMRTHPDIGLLIQFFARCQQTCCNFWLCTCDVKDFRRAYSPNPYYSYVGGSLANNFSPQADILGRKYVDENMPYL